MNRSRSGFTLVELIVVTAIIAVLAGAGYSYYMDSLQESREAVVKYNLRVVREALSRHFKDDFRYPVQLEALTGRYLQKSMQELLVFPLSDDTKVYVEVPTANTSAEASQATETQTIQYLFDGSNTDQIKNVRIFYNGKLMDW
jgi:general secretion pathway protein G